ncbi:MAG: cation-translocating P-type ATPase [Betaproteobacteria bacterium]|nr:cation-translocating P-type ATPase [Betaproteobacteria bacterium]
MSEARRWSGLSEVEAAARLKRFGRNELPGGEHRSLLRIVLEVIRQPMFALLLSGGFVYLFLGESLDAIVLLIFASLSVIISIVQESRSERVLDALRDLASPRALVIRDGVQKRIAGAEVVPGDLMLLAEGDRVPADALLLEGEGVLADESLLTGESVPVRKRGGAEEAELGAPGGEDRPALFAGTLVARGSGLARVVATGSASQMGNIGRSLAAIELEQARLQAQLSWLVRDFAAIGVAVALFVVVLLGFLRGSWLNAALGGIAVGMSVMPEEIPLVLAVFMAMGAWRIARARVLTRRAAAIETLGAATVLCTDKTGTLTQNRMRVEIVATEDVVWRWGEADPDETIARIVQAALGASASLPTDPMDRAIHEAAGSPRSSSQALVRHYALSTNLFATSNLWRDGDGDALNAFAKGAPEAIAELCRMPAEAHARLLAQTDLLAAQGYRLLAVAEAHLRPQDGAHPLSQRQIPFNYLGLVGFADPLRDSVPAAVAECRSAGIRVIMITGDYPATAKAIAARAGIDGHGVLTGDELDGMSDDALAEWMKTVSVFARIRPEQKLRLVQALKRDGEIVAMTGDGVNDAPAMKAAHIGIAMGGRGTDVAREAASLVLLDDDFASIVHAVRLGRGIFDNLRKAMAYIFAVHIPIIGLSLIPLLLGWPPVFAPVHIVFLEMIINPACSIAFEAEPAERGVMHRPPRDPQEPLFGKHTLLLSLLQGILVLLATLTVLGYVLSHGTPEPQARALIFSTLVVGNLGLILVNRSWQHTVLHTFNSRNPALWWVTGGAFGFLLLTLTLPFLREVFHFAKITPYQFVLCLAAGLCSVLWFELYKLFRRH